MSSRGVVVDTYWHKQSHDQPLFPDMQWSRPENRAHAGKLTIIGGNAYGFSHVGNAFATAEKSGIGTCRVVLPLAIKKVIGGAIEHAEFAASNHSGSFAKDSLGELLLHGSWADGVLIAGDLGKNSETAVVLESLIQKLPGQIVLANDTIDYTLLAPESILNRPNITLITTFTQLQKLIQHAGHPVAATTQMDLMHLVELLHDFTTIHANPIVTEHDGKAIVAVDGRVSTTQISDYQPAKVAAAAGVWQIQNPDKPFQALTTSLLDL